MHRSIVVVGAGNMGGAFLTGILRVFPPSQVAVTDPNPHKLALWPTLRRAEAPREGVEGAGCVILAVKPHQLDALCAELQGALRNTLVISLLAGIPLEKLCQTTGATRVVRAMPNLGAQVGQSLTGWIATPELSADDRVFAQQLLHAVGEVLEVHEEEQLDAITALSGAGPAYFFYLTELLEGAARAQGFAPEDARLLAERTFTGAAAYFAQSRHTASEARTAVSSKGGVTEAALAHLRAQGLPTLLEGAVEAGRQQALHLRGIREKEISPSLKACLERTKLAWGKRPKTEAEINAVLMDIADALCAEEAHILAANAEDMQRVSTGDPKTSRLQLTSARIRAMARDVRAVAAIPCPQEVVQEERTLPNGLHLQKVTVPLGVIGMIYEARPNVTVDAFALAFKAGNAVVLKGGKEASASNTALVAILQRVLAKHGFPTELVQLLPSDRTAVEALLQAVGFVDVVIPRGSQGLIDFVRDHARVPVIETGAGVCHTYVHTTANIHKARKVLVNAKTSHPSACNALDCLLLDAAQLPALPLLLQDLAPYRVLVHADPEAYAALERSYPTDLLHPATPESFGTEFLSLALSIKTVSSFEEALTHLAAHSSQHSEAILAEDPAVCEAFLKRVDAAVVYSNASTYFTDGAQFGLGAEIGISTQKLHARGPMGLREMTTYTWRVRGQGQVRL